MRESSGDSNFSAGAGPEAPSPVSRTPRGSTEILDPGVGSSRQLEVEVHQAASALSARLGRLSNPDASIEIPPPSTLGPRDARTADPYIGTTFDHRYKIERLLGEGGMGSVYLARHKVIDKKVAIKVLRAEMAKDRDILDRFLQEARAASSIGHPHIVDISDFGDLPDGSTYFVMEYLEGKSLGALMESLAAEGRRLPLERLLHVALQLADGLAGAHAAGIVHRDLKPDNVFIVTRGQDRDFVKILDFGIAKVVNQDTTKLTRKGAVFGTPHYMSPEQAAGAPVDHRTDVYSLGVMLYELVAGELPFNADNFMGILTQHMYKAPAPIRALVSAPDCPPGLEAVILKCLSKKPDARYASMEELAADLERLRRGEAPKAIDEMMARSGGFNVPHDFFKAAPVALVPATPPASRRPLPRALAIGAGALVVAIGIGAGLVAMRQTGASVPPEAAPTAAPGEQSAPPKKDASGGSSASAAKPEPRRVSVAAFPENARALRDGKEIKLPATVEVPDGQKVKLEVEAEGYASRVVELDGKEPIVQVTLEPAAKATKAPELPAGSAGSVKSPAKPPKPSKPPKPAGDVFEPW